MTINSQQVFQVTEEQLEALFAKLPPRTVVELERVLRQQGVAQATIACFEALTTEETVIVHRGKHRVVGRMNAFTRETVFEVFVGIAADESKQAFFRIAEAGVFISVVHGNFSWLQDIAQQVAPHVATSGAVFAFFTVGASVFGSFFKSVEE